MKRRGFTLIELLVVIAIISILAAILFPVFARARANARRAACQSNLKQIGLGVMMYVQDYDEFYPPSRIPTTQAKFIPGGATGYWEWMNIIYPYVKSSQAFRCPEGDALDSDYRRNYGVISSIFNAPISMAIVISSANTYMIMDAGAYRASLTNTMVCNPNFTVSPGAFRYLPGAGTVAPSFADTFPATGYEEYRKDYMKGRHFEGVNVAFADGHVKWLKSSTVRAEACKYSGTLHPPSAWDPQSNN